MANLIIFTAFAFVAISSAVCFVFEAAKPSSGLAFPLLVVAVLATVALVLTSLKAPNARG